MVSIVIKVIVFDLGGVYFTDGTSIAVKKIRKLVNVSPEKVDETFRDSPNKEGSQYRLGNLTKEKFWKIAKEKLNLNPRLLSKIRKIWLSSYKPNRNIVRIIKELKKKYVICFLSNNIGERVGYLDKKYHFLKYFDTGVFSYEVHIKKPNIEIYRIFLKKIPLKPQEIVYVDDKETHLEPAKKLGMNIIEFRSIPELERILSRFL